MGFEDLVVDARLRRGLNDQAYESPTPIQALAIPPGLEGRDVLGTAQTGTGKTLAFLLPSFQHLLTGSSSRGPRMIVLAPTRELAIQIAGDATRLARHTPLKVGLVYGGAPMGAQTQSLRRGVDVVIATPGRLLDHMRRGNLRLGEVRIVVLDEADRMLDMGFRPDIESIVAATPAERQTLMFSATMSPAITALSYRFLRTPVRLEAGTAKPPQAIVQAVFPVPKHLKLGLLIDLLGRADVSRALVFTRTRHEADYLARKLRERSLSVAAIHGDFQQRDRIRALEQFRSAAVRVLVATNVAARGLDIEAVSHVINFDVPDDADDYIHRIGRTARLDAPGTAWTLVTPEDEPLLSSIEYHLGRPIERIQVTGFDYRVPTPDWAKPSARDILRNAKRNQSSFDRWKTLTR